jgi:hypothetical protein
MDPALKQYFSRTLKESFLSGILFILDFALIIACTIYFGDRFGNRSAAFAVTFILNMGTIHIVVRRWAAHRIEKAFINLGFSKVGNSYGGIYKNKSYRLSFNRPFNVSLPAIGGCIIGVKFDNVVPPFVNSYEIQKALSSQARTLVKEQWDGLSIDDSFSVTPTEIRTEVRVGLGKSNVAPWVRGSPYSIDVRLPQMLDLLSSVRADLEVTRKKARNEKAD